LKNWSKKPTLKCQFFVSFFQAYQIFQDYRPAGYSYLFFKTLEQGVPWFSENLELGDYKRAKRITQHFKSISTGAQYVTPDSKFIVKKSKCAGLAQEIGSSAPTSCSLPWLANGAT
jgi:hypothetical protein